MHPHPCVLLFLLSTCFCSHFSQLFLFIHQYKLATMLLNLPELWENDFLQPFACSLVSIFRDVGRKRGSFLLWSPGTRFPIFPVSLCLAPGAQLLLSDALTLAPSSCFIGLLCHAVFLAFISYIHAKLRKKLPTSKTCISPYSFYL